ncbi:response regulator [Streptomyces sp. Qhu-G9]|uniref:response regulator transcription factor n=1 Tax=Streptomyces sp. Qhu-G9 TaxID=3452799 RepID=UPI0022ABF06A|nr:response regulator [Streptomyces aurantiacus]WAU80347.1 response regulator [Streptomyces aurantiacus]
MLAADDVLLREGPVSPCERLGHEVAGRAGDAGALVDLVEEHLPDQVIVDIGMPPTHSTEGLKAARGIRERYPDLGILVLSAIVEVEDAPELMAEGCSDAGIGRRPWATGGTVEKHLRSILGKLGLPEAADGHRRVPAVLTFLESR